MTQKSLIIRCFLRSGVCKNCPYAAPCESYKKIYGNDPYEDDEVHPERYIDKEIVLD